MGQDVDASCLGDEWKGYTLRITGGNDKQGFPMKQGVLTNGRVRLLLKKGHSCFRERRAGQKNSILTALFKSRDFTTEVKMELLEMTLGEDKSDIAL